MSKKNLFGVSIGVLCIVSFGIWYAINHESRFESKVDISGTDAKIAESSLIIDMPPLLVPESRGGRIVNIALLTISLEVSTQEDAERVSSMVSELRSEYKEDLEVFLTDRPISSLEARLADFSSRIGVVNSRLLGEGVIKNFEVDEPTAKPNDAPVPKKK